MLVGCMCGHLILLYAGKVLSGDVCWIFSHGAYLGNFGTCIEMIYVTIPECMAACAANSRCKSFNYLSSAEYGVTCYLMERSGLEDDDSTMKSSMIYLYLEVYECY